MSHPAGNTRILEAPQNLLILKEAQEGLGVDRGQAQVVGRHRKLHGVRHPG